LPLPNPSPGVGGASNPAAKVPLSLWERGIAFGEIGLIKSDLGLGGEAEIRQ